MTETDPAVLLLMYLILPLWFAAGVADWLCHRASGIERTTGAKESLIHLLMLGEIAVPLLAAVFLEINAGIIALMVAVFFLHEATALWDVSYATTARTVTPIEQHVHSFLEMIPLMGIVSVVALHWGQALALLGLGPEEAGFALSPKTAPLPGAYILSLLAGAAILEVAPYAEELFRGLGANRGALVPAKARRAKAAGRHTYSR